MNLKQSNTIIIKRSQIKLNPYNPKNHSDEKVKFQKKNLQEVGYLGGVTWNKVTGNLIDGHRRIKAMDLCYKYDGTESTDYDVKVEEVELNSKQEKEQMTYMALGNTKADYNLVAEYINDIDYSSIGLNSDELTSILSLAEKESQIIIDSIDELITPNEDIEEPLEDEEPSYEDRKQQMKDVKQKCKEKAIERQKDEEAFIMLSFSTHEAKLAFCELVGCDIDEKFVKGETVLNIIEE